MMDLVHSHQFPKLYDLQKQKTWKQKEGMDVSDRVGKRVGILGYGSIGRQGMSRSLFHKIEEEVGYRDNRWTPQLRTWIPDLYAPDQRLQHQYSVCYAEGTA